MEMFLGLSHQCVSPKMMQVHIVLSLLFDQVVEFRFFIEVL